MPADSNPPLPTLPDRIRVAGLAIDPVELRELFAYVVAAAKSGRHDGVKRTIAYLNVHVANLAAGDSEVERYLNEASDLVYCDGRGIGWGARLQGLAEPPRMTAADWLPDLLVTLRDAGLRTFVVAGKPGVAQLAVERMADSVCGLGPIATHDGYLDEQKTADVCDQIAEFGADVVLVGMGSPTQERWTLAKRDRIDAPVVWTLGATFDYYAGEQARGPAWLRDAGHEWAARLLADPFRLWRRYVLGNPRFLWRAWRTRGKPRRGS